jgi:hypothetical protein
LNTHALEKAAGMIIQTVHARNHYQGNIVSGDNLQRSIIAGNVQTNQQVIDVEKTVRGNYLRVVLPKDIA